jgi:hypothetical protein
MCSWLSCSMLGTMTFRGGMTTVLAWLCLVLASIVLVSLVVGGWARLAPVALWMGGVCGEWAPPSSRHDPRCLENLLPREGRAFATAKWSAGGLLIASLWLLDRRRKVRSVALTSGEKPRWYVLLGVSSVTVLAVAAWIVWPRPTEAENIGQLGPDGVCRTPLAQYCDQKPLVLPITSSKPCPTYAAAVETARNYQPLLEASAGTCGDLRWVKWSSGFNGETTYFDSADTLVAVEAWADYYPYCWNHNAALVYGSRPACKEQTTLTLRQRP